jgi:hypothetical protein
MIPPLTENAARNRRAWRIEATFRSARGTNSSIGGKKCMKNRFLFGISPSIVKDSKNN